MRLENTKMLGADYYKNMPLDEITIAEALKEGGYTTGFFGKWHCCWEEKYYPQHQGFDVNMGGNNMGNPGNYFYPYDGKWRMTKDHPWVEWNTLPDGKPGEYLTDRLTDEAEKFIDQNENKPFYLNLSHYAVHTPLQAEDIKIDNGIVGRNA
jgi:arylsulfatase A-like enzyme